MFDCLNIGAPRFPRCLFFKSKVKGRCQMNKYVSLVISALIILAAFTGCGQSGFPTAKTIGIVKCQGQPVSGAMVYFEPIPNGDNALAGKQGFAFTNAEGKFEISTYTVNGNDGAVVGKHRVRVGRGDAKCNCAMNEEVDLMEVEIKAGETNEFTLDLKVATVADKQKEAQLSDDEEDEKTK